MTTSASPAVGIEVLADWTPTRGASLSRFDLLVKVGRGHVVADTGAARLELLDAAGGLLATVAPVLAPAHAPLEGPAWRQVRGRLVDVDETAAAARAVLGGVRSRPVDRAEGERAAVLVAVRDVLGIEREPHLWWRYRHTGSQPVPVQEILTSTVLWLDGVPLRPPTAYNGPAMLPPGRAVSGLWTLDDLTAAPGAHRARLEVLGSRSGDVRVAAVPPPGTAIR